MFGAIIFQISLLQVYAYLSVDAVLVCTDLCVPLQSVCRCSFPTPGHFRSYHRYVQLLQSAFFVCLTFNLSGKEPENICKGEAKPEMSLGKPSAKQTSQIFHC